MGKELADNAEKLQTLVLLNNQLSADLGELNKLKEAATNSSQLNTELINSIKNNSEIDETLKTQLIDSISTSNEINKNIEKFDVSGPQKLIVTNNQTINQLSNQFNQSKNL